MKIQACYNIIHRNPFSRQAVFRGDSISSENDTIIISQKEYRKYKRGIIENWIMAAILFGGLIYSIFSRR